jgi:hypothetical protein
MPRLQVATIADMLAGKMPKLPPIPEPQRGTKPPRKVSRDQIELLLPFEGQRVAPTKGDFIDPRFDPRFLPQIAE